MVHVDHEGLKGAFVIAPILGHKTAQLRHPSTKPPLALRVGFAGHRDTQPVGAPPRTGDPEKLHRNLDAAFTLIQQTVEALERLKLPESDGATLGEAFSERRLQLVTGVAPGADGRAVTRWRAAALGPIHALTPFLDPVSSEPLTDEPAKALPEDWVKDLSIYESWTCLDPRAHGRHGHAELSRWIVRHSEVLVVIWDGAAAVGPGGTADTVRLGLSKGLPILWIAPNLDGLQLLDPCDVWADDGALERTADPLSIAKSATVENLEAALELRFRPPTSDPSKEHGGKTKDGHKRKSITLPPFAEPVDRWIDQLFGGNLWRLFDWFKTNFGGRYIPGPPPEPVACADIDAQPGFVALKAQFESADNRANLLSAAHRSEQLLLLALAFVAVAVGAYPAPLDRPIVHIGLLCAELGLGLLAWLIWFFGQSKERNRRWSDARQLAERLRASLVTYPLGFDIADQRPGPPQTRTEWRARAVLRAAGVTSGVLTMDVLHSRLNWAAAEIIGGQSRYHSKEAKVTKGLEEKLGTAETCLFFVLVASLLLALASAIWLSAIPLMPPTAPPTPLQSALEKIIKGATFLSAVVPAAGAAIFAIEATSGFSDIAERSSQYARSFNELGRRMAAEAPMSGAQGQEIIREAANLLVSDTNSWRDQLVRRRLVRGG